MQKLCKKITGFTLSAVLALTTLAGFTPSIVASANETPQTQVQAQLYVAVNGKDSNDGTQEKPFATVDRARQEVEKINDNMNGDIIVNIGAGNYYLDSTLEFNENDSGSNGYEVIYRSADGIGQAHLIGGDKITGWTLATQEDVTGFDLVQDLVGQVYKAQLDKEAYDFNTLYVNDNRAIMARTKNKVKDGRFPSANGEYMVATGGLGKSGIVYNPKDLTQKEIDGMVNAEKRGDLNAQMFIWSWDVRDWFTDTCYIDRIDSTSNRIHLKTDPKDPVWNTAKYPIGGGARFFLQGNLAFLDAPGEYYYNNNTGTLYYYPIEGEDMATAVVVVPTLDEIIKLKGAEKADLKDEPVVENQVHNITFDGLTVEKTDFPGYYSAGWDYGPWGYPEASKGSTNPTFCAQTERIEYQYGAVTMINTNNITIENSRFNNLGFNGVVMYLDNDSNTIQNSEFSNLGYGGIMLDGGYPGVGKYNNNHIVKNVLIHDIGQLVGHASGVTVLSSGYNTFSHMEIFNSPRRSIFISSWQKQTAADANYDDYNDIYVKYNKFEYIYAYNCEQDGGDDGSIFTFCLFTDPNRCHPNYFENIVVDKVGAASSMKDFTPNGMNLDCSAIGVELKNMKIINPQHYNFRVDDKLKVDNINKAYYSGAKDYLTFDDSKMEYDKIGLTDGFPTEYKHADKPVKQYDELYYREEFDDGLSDWWSLAGKTETTPVYFSDSEDFMGNSFLADAFYNSSNEGCRIGKPFGTDLNKIVEIDFFDHLSGGKNNGYCGQSFEWKLNSFARVDDGKFPKAIGVDSRLNNDYFSYKVGSIIKVSDIKRSYGWHKFKWDYTSGTDVKMYIDNELIASAPAKSFDYIEMGDYGAKGFNAYDNVVIYGGEAAEPPMKLPPAIDPVNPEQTIYIPGKAEAEFAEGTNLIVADCNDGGKMLSDFTTDVEADLEVFSAKDRDYTFDLRYAAKETAQVEVTVNNESPVTIDLAATGGLTTWKTKEIISQYSLKAGKNIIKIKGISGSINLNYMTVNIYESAPGKVEAESGIFSGGSQPTKENADGGVVLGNVKNNQVYTYTVNAKEAGEYSLKYRAAVWYDGQKVECYVNDTLATTTNLSGIRSWDIYQNIDGGKVALNKGENKIVLKTGGAGPWVWNFNWFSINTYAPTGPSDTTSLESTIAQTELLLSMYSSTSDYYKELTAVLKEALSVYNDPTSQEAVDAAIVDLENAMEKFLQQINDSSTDTAQDVVDKISIETPFIGDEKVKILNLPEFYTAQIISSNPDNYINKNGNIIFPDIETVVTLSIKVTKQSDNTTAIREIPVTLSKFTVQDVADSITVEDPIKGAKFIVMPTVPYGFKIGISSSTDNLISIDGAITTPMKSQEVDVIFTVSKAATNTSVDKVIKINLTGFAKPYDNEIEANDIDALSGSYIQILNNEVINFNPGDWIRYDYVDFGETPKDIKAKLNLAVYPGWAGKKIYIMLDDVNNGTKLGEVTVEANPVGGNWGVYYIHEVELTQKLSGVHTIYLLGVAGGPIPHEGVAGVKEIVFEDITPPASTTYALTVTDGTGSGEYEENATVTIVANAPIEGKVFDKWTSEDEVIFADANNATTTFTMLAKAVTVTATYKDKPEVSIPPVTTDDSPIGWVNQDTIVTLNAVASSSEVADTYYIVDDGEQQTGTSVVFSEEGVHKLVYWSVDKAGNVEQAHTVTVSIDKTAPEIQVTVPEDNKTYEDSGDLTLQYTLADALSGVDSSNMTVTLDGIPYQIETTIPLYTLPLGHHTLVILATDLAGNQGSKTVSFQTVASIDSLKALVTLFANNNWIDNHGIANSLQAKLKNNNLNSFVNEVKAQSGKHISREAAEYLLRDAEYIRAQK